MARANRPSDLTRDSAVILDVVLENRILLFRLANIGAKPVTGIRVTFNRKIMGIGGRVEITGLPVFGQLDFLAPGRVIDVPIDRAAAFFALDNAEPLIARVSYVDFEGRPIHAEMHHDLAVWREMPEIG